MIHTIVLFFNRWGVFLKDTREQITNEKFAFVWSLSSGNAGRYRALPNHASGFYVYQIDGKAFVEDVTTNWDTT